MKTTNCLAPTARLGLAISIIAFAATAALTSAWSANEPAANGSTQPVTTSLNSSTSTPALTAAGASPSATAKPDTSKDTYYLSDYLSTTIGTVDAAGEIDQMETDAFGAPLSAGRPPARFTGKPYDEDMGAYIFRFRNYRPDEARWMTPDPSGFPDGTNNLRYVPVPTSNIDRLGLAEVDIYSHSVFAGLQHSFLVIYPDPDDETLQNALNIDSIDDLQQDTNGTPYFTIGAGPSSGWSSGTSGGSAGVGGFLIGGFGRPTEAMDGTSGETQNFVQTISTDESDVDGFATAGVNYWGGSVLHYSPTTARGHNSNSFTAGIISFVLGCVPDESFIGWGKPVDGKYFQE